MAKQHISLGATPAEESCAQVGTDGYELLARNECRRYLKLLRDVYVAAHGAMHEGLNLRIASNAHDFGSYLDVIVEFDVDDESASNAALWLDNNRPAEWPDAA
jgi:hypothetical protein